MELESRYPDLAEITKGASYTQLFDFFYKASIIRYFTPGQLRGLNYKIGTIPKLAKLIDKGYIEEKSACHLTKKTFSLLKAEGFNLSFIQTIFRGNPSDHLLQVSDRIFKYMTLPEFFFAFYPTFKRPPDYKDPFLEPDACVILKQDDRARLFFLEVELKKPEWEGYLIKKKDKYEEIARDPNLHSKWWSNFCAQKGLRLCDQKEFGFSVRCIGPPKLNWKHWTFEEE